MTRINVTGPIGTDDYGQPATGLIGWFDADKAIQYDEATEWDGSNRVSKATGIYSEHQALYRTASGRWVLNSWSQWQGRPDIYEFIDEARAREWLLLNDHDQAATGHFGEIEEERGPGRPEVGARVDVRLGDLLAAVDVYAEAHGQSRAEAIRALVTAGLQSDGTCRSLA